MGKHVSSEFYPTNIALLTVSDSRTEAEDTSGHYFAEVAKVQGHHIVDKQIVKNDLYMIRAIVSQWIADPEVQVILVNGGTGFSAKNTTPEALSVLFDRDIEGFGELFRMFSYEDIGTSAIQSRAVAGLANRTLIFAVPGSTTACQLAWQKIIASQLNALHGPCNFIPHIMKK